MAIESILAREERKPASKGRICEKSVWPGGGRWLGAGARAN